MSRSQFTVLLVEDDTDLREVFELTMQRMDLEVISFDSGVPASEWLDDHLPDLAILDMMIPQPSGFVLAERVKERSHGKVPVIMMSGYSSSAHRNFAYASGADRFLAKPFAVESMQDAIRQLLPSLPTSGPRVIVPRRANIASLRG